MAARARAGLVNGINLLLRDQIHSYETVVIKVTPTDCTLMQAREPGQPIERWWLCRSHNGDSGSSDSVYCRPAVGGPICTPRSGPSRTQAEDRASTNTSRPVAQAALPRLRAAQG
jgi:hypothetical protein